MGWRDPNEIARQLLEEGALAAAHRTAQLAGRLPRKRGGDGAEYAAHTAACLIAGPDDECPDNFDCDTEDGVLVEEDQIISSLQEAALNSDDITEWKQFSLQ